MSALSPKPASPPPAAALPLTSPHDPHQERELERAHWAPHLDQVRMRLGQAIRRRRRSINMTLESLGCACGVSLQQIQKYETGRQTISAAQLWTIACALGVPVADLFEVQRLR